mmetsp:Transcript_12185/g.18824  ORF Transcript_12185/g.18824 Transcript_12185/m.18824 type:complete len:245 (-) Transcript_12185:32-766(-)
MESPLKPPRSISEVASRLDDSGLDFNPEKARADSNIIELRNRLRLFLSTSALYEPISILEFLKPINKFLNKENAIIKMKLGRFKDAFLICINEVNDLQFAQSVARKGFEWHSKDRRIYYNLFKLLLETGDPLKKTLAIQILAKNCSNIPYEKLTKNFEDEEDLSLDLNKLYSKVFEHIESNMKLSQLLKKLSSMEILNLELSKKDTLGQWFEINSTSQCSICYKAVEGDLKFDPETCSIMHAYH